MERTGAPVPTEGPALRKVADQLMATRGGMKLRDATLLTDGGGRRIQFFKGKRLAEHVLSLGNDSGYPMQDEAECDRVGRALLNNRILNSDGNYAHQNYIYRVKIERKGFVSASTGHERLEFDPDGMYTWAHETKGTARLKNLLLFGIIAGFIGE